MVELDTKGEMTRSEVANFLRTFADELTGSGGGARTTRRAESGTGRSEPGDPSSRDGTAGPNDRPEDPRTTGDARRITFIVGGDSATVTVPKTVEFDVEVDSRSPLLSSGVTQEIEFDLSWEVEEPDESLTDDSIDIE